MSDVSKTNELIAELKDLNATTEYTDDWLSDLVGRAADALEAATRVPAQGEPNVCLDHKPVQHRDGKPPWCNTCGRATVPDAALAAVERVRAIHKRSEGIHGYDVCEASSCLDYSADQQAWPCPTIAALDGAPEPEPEEEMYQAGCGSWDCRAPECGRES